MEYKESAKKYKWLIIGVLVAAVALVSLWAFGTGGEADSASVAGMTEGEAGTVDSGEGAFVTDSEGRLVLASDSNSGASGASGTDGSSGSDGSGDPASGDSGAPNSFPPGGGSAEDPPPPAPEGAVMDVRIMFWNDTSSNTPEGCQIIVDGKTWDPDTAPASDSGTIEGLAYDKTLELIVLPNGSGGDRFTVPITFTSVMESGSEQDAVHVEISDGEVRVLGNAVDNFDVRFDRS